MYSTFRICFRILNRESIRIPLEVRLFTRMPMEVPNLPNYSYVQKNTLNKVIIHSNLQAIFTIIPFKHKFLYLSDSLCHFVPNSVVFLFILVHWVDQLSSSLGYGVSLCTALTAILFRKERVQSFAHKACFVAIIS